MASTVKRGNYYKKKTQKWFEDKGYTVELTEFVCGRQIAPGKIIYMKTDILASDGIAYNEKEFILWNAKHWMNTGKDHQTLNSVVTKESKEYQKIKVPAFIKKQLVIWEPRKKPTIVAVD